MYLDDNMGAERDANLHQAVGELEQITDANLPSLHFPLQFRHGEQDVTNDQLDAQFFLIHLLQSFTCTSFEQYLARNMYMYRIVINVFLKNCASSWLLAKVIPRCTASETLTLR